LLIGEIANRLPGGGRLAGWLMGAAWGLATIFAVPLLALEDARPVEALRGSARFGLNYDHPAHPYLRLLPGE
jgi:hypothetical protein